ncbi:MAG: T9SS type B sorting domain-containing protein [Bacteroidetes bacterium]|jgi:gliding motility-associated-like protein|nr:T9SS type B sorting domain-containing protein [Bacteroidota bacterium]MBT5528702.1 T9SS type B sorting domain-containing protein [Cytophagia bacterium]MBT3422834.1 T9SS type B sorting domain-containing protein [Bacteroidota bacterium]MBT3935540.1 T9SS type B sorting domain-containing protein [Bacteroidota bacterium]MBT4339780.1 T9SS type B sorting domain-containing protein [Bacteroidota bacterium]
MPDKIQHTDPLFEAFNKGLKDFNPNIPEANMDADWSRIESNISTPQPSTGMSGMQGVGLKTIGFGIAGVAVVTTAIFLLTSKPENDIESAVIEEINKTELFIEDQVSIDIPEDQSTNYNQEAKQEIIISEKSELKDNSIIEKSSTASSSIASSSGIEKKDVVSDNPPTVTICSNSQEDLLKVADVSFSDTFICLGEVLKVSFYQPASSMGMRVYVLLPNQKKQIINGEISHKFNKSGDYFVEIVCTDNVQEVSRKQRIRVFELPQAEFSYENSDSKTINFENLSSNISTSIWSFGDGNNSNENSPVHQYTSSGNYMVILTVKTKEGCSNDLSKYIDIVTENEKVYPPNYFTPNGDGKNDYYYISLENTEIFQLTIIDRSGNILFNASDPNQKWDGKDMKTGKECLEGNYYYMLTYKYKGQLVSEKKSGTIYLTR